MRDINFRRGKEGEGRVVVDLSDASTGIDIRQQGGQPDRRLPEDRAARAPAPPLDVTDFGTPVTSMTAQQVGDRVRLTVTPNGLWEHNAYQSDNRSCSRSSRRRRPEQARPGRKRPLQGREAVAQLPERRRALGAAGHRRLHRLQHHHPTRCRAT
jgi:hypothetical protein